jgi:hypothetical protein
MPVLWEEYQSEINRILKTVDSKEYIRILEAKLIDYFSRNRNADLNAIKRFIAYATPPEFNKAANQIFNNYNAVIELVNDVYSHLGHEIQRDYTKVRAVEKVTQDYLGTFEKATENKLIKTIRSGLSKSLSESEFAASISKCGDSVSAYADTIAITKLKDYGNLIKLEKARIAEVLWFDYVGFLRKTSRPFCIEILKQSKAGKRWTIKQLDALDNGPKQPKPVSKCRGGWRCHHDIEPDVFYEP